MKRYEPIAILGSFITIVSFLLLLGGCSLEPRPPESFLDTPEHHVFNGFKLIKRGWLDDAQREFEIALQFSPKYSPAHRGMGLVYGMKKQFHPAFKFMQHAKDYAEKKEDKALAFTGFMRLYTMEKEKGWLEKVEENFDGAKTIKDDLPDAYYYMGIAYKYGYRFNESDNAFKKVLEINSEYSEEAEQQLRIIQKIKKAMPESPFARRLAVVDHITRADVAALFIHELKLDQIYKKKRDSKKGYGSLPPDVRNHPLRNDVARILKMDIQGLRPFPDGNFGPDDYITRAGYAIMISDIIAIIKDDPSLTTRYLGWKSPFKDVRNDAPYFNAIIVCATMGEIMEARHGIFNPMGKVSGADALLIIRKLKEKFKIFVTTREPGVRIQKPE